jgi:hypothetical protein
VQRDQLVDSVAVPEGIVVMVTQSLTSLPGRKWKWQLVGQGEQSMGVSARFPLEGE